MTSIVDTQTNEFCPQGHEIDARYICVSVPRNPDPAKEKYSGDPANPIVAKTPAEITAAHDAAVDAVVSSSFEAGKLLKAVVISTEAYRLGKAPGTLTTADLAAAKARIVAIYKGLP